MPSTAERVVVEGFAAALTGYDLAVAVRSVDLELAWASLEEVGFAADYRAHALAFMWGNG